MRGKRKRKKRWRKSTGRNRSLNIGCMSIRSWNDSAWLNTRHLDHPTTISGWLVVDIALRLRHIFWPKSLRSTLTDENTTTGQMPGCPLTGNAWNTFNSRPAHYLSKLVLFFGTSKMHMIELLIQIMVEMKNLMIMMAILMIMVKKERKTYKYHDAWVKILLEYYLVKS